MLAALNDKDFALRIARLAAVPDTIVHLAVILVDGDANMFGSAVALLGHAVERHVVRPIARHGPLRISAAMCVA